MRCRLVFYDGGIGGLRASSCPECLSWRRRLCGLELCRHVGREMGDHGVEQKTDAGSWRGQRFSPNPLIPEMWSRKDPVAQQTSSPSYNDN
jgi:hypothetical protein